MQQGLQLPAARQGVAQDCYARGARHRLQERPVDIYRVWRPRAARVQPKLRAIYRDDAGILEKREQCRVVHCKKQKGLQQHLCHHRLGYRKGAHRQGRNRLCDDDRRQLKEPLHTAKREEIFPQGHQTPHPSRSPSSCIARCSLALVAHQRAWHRNPAPHMQ